MRTGISKHLLMGLMAASLFACGEPEEKVDPVPDAGQTEVDAGETDAGIDPEVEDNDIAVVRLNADGTRDTSYGTDGVAIVNFGAGAGSARDSIWDMKLDGMGRPVLFGSMKGEDRADVDRVVARLTTSGQLDADFGTDGLASLNVGGLNDNARGGILQEDGKIMASGYTSMPTGVGVQTANAVVLQRLNSDGTPDPAFGFNGVLISNPFAAAAANTPWGMAEAYAVGMQSSGNYVTTGYGRVASSGAVDLVSFSFNAAGEPVDAWGAEGNYVLDVAADNDRGRNLVVLEDDSVVMVGSAVPMPNDIDAMVVWLDESGAPTSGFGTNGVELFSFQTKEEALFGVAANADRIAATGYSLQTGDDDSVLVLVPRAGGETFAAVVPLSESGHDRLYSAVIGADGKVYGAGYVQEGDDRQMVVARFNTDGTLDSSFGTGGVVKVNVVEAGQVELARAIAIQADGKILIAGPVEAK